MTGAPESINKGQLPAYVFRLGQRFASGVLTVRFGDGTQDLLVLRRGAVVGGELPSAGAVLEQRMAVLVARANQTACEVSFDGATRAYPPGRMATLPLAQWLRTHFERQVDGIKASALVNELAGVRLQLPPNAMNGLLLDEADQRIVAAMQEPRRLDQIWSIARTPRFRLLAFLHFARVVGIVEYSGVAAERSGPIWQSPAREAAARLLGVDLTADELAIKRAYHRRMRHLHPDLHPALTQEQRREHEAQIHQLQRALALLLAQVTQANCPMPHA